MLKRIYFERVFFDVRCLEFLKILLNNQRKIIPTLKIYKLFKSISTFLKNYF